MYHKYVDIICIYILEAHWVEENEGLDGWPIGSSYRIPRHKTIDDRVKMAKDFIEEFDWKIPTFVDTFENKFNEEYGTWPDRGYVIYKNKLIYVSSVNEDGTRSVAWTKEIEDLLFAQ